MIEAGGNIDAFLIELFFTIDCLAWCGSGQLVIKVQFGRSVGSEKDTCGDLTFYLHQVKRMFCHVLCIYGKSSECA